MTKESSLWKTLDADQKSALRMLSVRTSRASLYELTERDRDILKYWVMHIEERGRWPTVREAQRFFQAKWPFEIWSRLRKLKELGLMGHEPYRCWFVIQTPLLELLTSD